MHVVVSLETVLHIVAQIRVSAIFGVEVRVLDTWTREYAVFSGPVRQHYNYNEITNCMPSIGL